MSRHPPKTLLEAAEGLSSQQILDALHRGLEYSLGEETKMLLLRTLKLVYKLDEAGIASSLERFDELMGKILGSGTAAIVRRHIIQEMDRTRSP